MDRKELLAVLILVALVAIAATARLSSMAPFAFGRPRTPKRTSRRPINEADAGVIRLIWPQHREHYRPKGLEAVTLFDAGERIFAEGLFDAAIATYAHFLEEHPRQRACEIARFRIAHCHSLAERDAEAAAHYDAFLKLHPHNELRPAALLWSGVHHARLGQATLARRRLTEVIDKFPDSVFAAGARDHLAKVGPPEPPKPPKPNP
ncbi:MAG: tetratricopeptide repeat protein [Candidatus Brocadiae bacterium]|nr:tetratricopeptide repeat protein [Candidatus Brocadiia bacterium]